MRTHLIQKKLFKATHEYEIDDDQIIIRIKSRTKNETITVLLAVLEPEPVITKTHLEFVSRVNGEPLVSLLLSKPNVQEFNEFVNTLKKMALDEYNIYTGFNVSSEPAPAIDDGLEPPEFGDHSTADIIKGKKVSIPGLENSITMLETYVDNDEVKPLITTLQALIHAPTDHSKLVAVAHAFNELGASQGAVLTYAPYISIMLSDDPFGSE